jgi:hypothetical protein
MYYIRYIETLDNYLIHLQITYHQHESRDLYCLEREYHQIAYGGQPSLTASFSLYGFFPNILLLLARRSCSRAFISHVVNQLYSQTLLGLGILL